MLQLDRITEISGNRIVAEIDLTQHWVFPLHFPKDPIFPGSMLIEAAGQVIAVWAWNAGLRGKARLAKVSAKFVEPVLREHGKVRLVGTVRQRRCVCFGSVEMHAGGKLVGTTQGLIIVVPEKATNLAVQPMAFASC